jgi:Sortase domain
MPTRKQGHRRLLTLRLAALLLAVSGAVVLTVAVRAQRHPPQPPPQIAGSYSLAATTPTTSANGPTAALGSTSRSAAGPGTPAAAPTGPTGDGIVLPASAPIQLRIPAIGVRSDLLQLGLNPDGSVQVPPLSRNASAGWYRYSPTPGQLGPAVILGHIDSAAYGPGVFFRLGGLRPGNNITITRADHTTAVFRVDAVAEYPKTQFPTLTVYGNANRAELRLITCGGRFDFTAHSYQDNIVAYATLTAAIRP